MSDNELRLFAPRTPTKPQVVIVGAGFAGLYAAKQLRKANVEITLIDRRNHHLFQPLLYQVATAALSPGDIAQPIRAIFSEQDNVHVLLGEVTGIDREGRTVVLRDGRVRYDYLILATGATHAYFGNDHWSEHAPGLKTLDDGLEIRRRILLAFERAEREQDPNKRNALLTFVVVGGGPTGVEMAGAIAEISKRVLRHDFRSIDPADARVVLVEGGDRILSAYSPELSRKAEEQLRELGAWVWTGRLVTSISDERVELGEEMLQAATVVWAAGVAASPLGSETGGERDRAGRVHVNPDLRVAGDERIFVAGDLAHLEGADGRPLPGVAPVAVQQGIHAAKNIRRLLAKQETEQFRYADKGSLATIGRAAAVGKIGRMSLSGFSAWMLWALVHIMYLAGYRNRIAVLIDWVWSYVTFKRPARLITGAMHGEPAPARTEPEPEEATPVA